MPPFEVATQRREQKKRTIFKRPVIWKWKAGRFLFQNRTHPPSIIFVRQNMPSSTFFHELIGQATFLPAFFSQMKSLFFIEIIIYFVVAPSLHKYPYKIK